MTTLEKIMIGFFMFFIAYAFFLPVTLKRSTKRIEETLEKIEGLLREINLKTK